MSASTSSSLSDTGSVTLTKLSGDSLTTATLNGTYGTVTFVFEKSYDGTNFFPTVAIRDSDGVLVSGTISPSDNTTYGWKIPSEGTVRVRARVTAIASGSVTFTIESSNYSNLPFVSVANTGQTLNGPISCTALTATSVAATGTVALTDHMTVTDGKNVVVDTTTGTKIGTAVGQKIGFWNATPIVQPVGASQGAISATLTDSTGLSGTHDDTLAATTVPSDLTGGEAPTEAEHNALLAVIRLMAQNASDSAQKIIELVTLVNALRTALVNAGVIKGAA